MTDDHRVHGTRGLFRAQMELATFVQPHATLGEAREPPRGAQPIDRVGLDDVGGDPTVVRDEVLDPATVARVMGLALALRIDAVAHLKARGDAACAGQRDEERVQIRAASAALFEAHGSVADPARGLRRVFRIVIRLVRDVLEQLLRLRGRVRVVAADLVRHRDDRGRRFHVRRVEADFLGVQASVDVGDRTDFGLVDRVEDGLAANLEVDDDGERRRVRRIDLDVEEAVASICVALDSPSSRRVDDREIEHFLMPFVVRDGNPEAHRLRAGRDVGQRGRLLDRIDARLTEGLSRLRGRCIAREESRGEEDAVEMEDHVRGSRSGEPPCSQECGQPRRPWPGQPGYRRIEVLDPHS